MWDDLIIGQRLGADKRVRRGYNRKQGEMFIEFPWQTRIEVRSADHPENLVGEGLAGVIMSEAAKQRKETWERYIRPALSDERGWATFPTTPEGFNWLYELFTLGQHPDYPEWESWKFPSWENPYVYPGGRQDPEIIEIERTTIVPWFLQEVGADFSAFVGKIYEDWDDTKHVREVKYNPAWPNYIAFDFGFVNPLAAIEFQVSPDDRVWIWREHYQSYWRLEDHLRYLAQRPQPDGYKIDLTFGDAADPEAIQTINEMFAPCYGMPEAKTNWRQGVDLVNKFVKLQQVGDADEYGTPHDEPRMFVDFSCKNFIREINNYRAASAPKTGTNPREDAKKTDDHAMDAIRYGLMHIFELGVTHHLDEIYDISSFEKPAPEFDFGTTGNTYFDTGVEF
jgi:hypothetical protein